MTLCPLRNQGLPGINLRHNRERKLCGASKSLLARGGKGLGECCHSGRGSLSVSEYRTGNAKPRAMRQP